MRERIIRWIRPAWLDWPQAESYSGLPDHILRGLIAQRLVRTKEAGRLIRRDSIDRILYETTLNRQPLLYGRQNKAKTHGRITQKTGAPA